MSPLISEIENRLKELILSCEDYMKILEGKERDTLQKSLTSISIALRYIEKYREEKDGLG